MGIEIFETALVSVIAIGEVIINATKKYVEKIFPNTTLYCAIVLGIVAVGGVIYLYVTANVPKDITFWLNSVWMVLKAIVAPIVAVKAVKNEAKIDKLNGKA